MYRILFSSKASSTILNISTFEKTAAFSQCWHRLIKTNYLFNCTIKKIKGLELRTTTWSNIKVRMTLGTIYPSQSDP